MNTKGSAPVVIAAGGTGGHIFPAEAVTSQLLQRGHRVILMTDLRSRSQASVVFRDCEQHVLGGAGVVGRSPLRAASSIARISRGVLQARQIMKRAKPCAVVGFGGYPSVAPVLATRLLRSRPTVFLHDQNAALGRANQFLARFADVLALSFEQTQSVPLGCVTRLIGNPVRQAIIDQAKAQYHPDQTHLNLLVLGGSLGAMRFASLVPEALAQLPEHLRGRLNLLMQCPEAGLSAARATLSGAGISAVLAPYIDNVADAMVSAHLVIARAGGSTVAEIAVVGRPAILIPLAINADQRANAAALARAGGAIQLDQDGLTTVKLAHVLMAILADPQRRNTMAKASAAFGVADAADRLATLILDEVSP